MKLSREGGIKISEENDSALECSGPARFVGPAQASESIVRGQIRIKVLIEVQTRHNVGPM